MDHQHRSFADSHPAVSTFYVFSGLVGLTQPITDLVSGAIAALRAMRSTAREKGNYSGKLSTARPARAI